MKYNRRSGKEFDFYPVEESLNHMQGDGGCGKKWSLNLYDRCFSWKGKTDLLIACPMPDTITYFLYIPVGVEGAWWTILPLFSTWVQKQLGDRHRGLTAGGDSVGFMTDETVGECDLDAAKCTCKDTEPKWKVNYRSIPWRKVIGE